MKKIKVHAKNFIQKIIAKDLASKKYPFIQTRFPPEPNGYLHIGHAKSICLNFNIAKKFNGKCNLRFDDTNPSQENKKYIRSILEDIQWLGFCWDGNIRYASDYFEKMFNFAIQLIQKNLAYVDLLSIEEIRSYRGTLKVPGKDSPYRNQSIEKNLSLFLNMRDGKFSVGKACLRAKIDMQSSLISMRDPILYRIKYDNHHKTKNKWCIYPTYDFAHCISDALEGITHSLCTLEFVNNKKLYNWILKNIFVDRLLPKQYEFSRLNIEYTVTSKRKLQSLINNNIVKDWDDPRMPTIAGLRRRGYTASSIRRFCERIGITRQNSIINMSMLESCIRDDLNKKAPRAMAVINPILVNIENFPKNYRNKIPMKNHPNNLKMGTREVILSKKIYIDRSDFCENVNNIQFRRLTPNQPVRLRYASCLIFFKNFKKDKNGKIIRINCFCSFSKKEEFLKNKQKIGIIHWVSATHCLNAEFHIYQKLFKLRDLEGIENLSPYINLNSLTISYGFVENSLLTAKIGDIFQFEREGYFCVDKSSILDRKKFIFNKTVSLQHKTKL